MNRAESLDTAALLRIAERVRALCEPDVPVGEVDSDPRCACRRPVPERRYLESWACRRCGVLMGQP